MTNKKLNYPAIAKEMAILTGAVAIIAAAVYFFLVPSHTSVSSISGLGIVLSNFVPLPLSAITMVLNIVLLIIGFFTCGREFGAKTVYTSVMLPVFLGLFEKLFPEFGSMTGSQELDVLCYILVVSIGLSILFNRNASSGGLDIVAKIMNKYLHMDLGRAMSLSGMCVALSAAFVYDKKTVVLSILGTYFNGIVLDHFIFDHNIKRRVCIITEKEEELRNFILNDLHSGATIYESIGAYNMQKRNEIITIVDKNEYQKLMNYILDPKADYGKPVLKRGLIIGDVQSGKTSTYIGFICKAADAGYKVFILLTGTIESLRQQTQERVEEGFIGIDMSANTTGGKRVGVGLDNKPIHAMALTSRASDFRGNSDKIAVSLGADKDAVVFVIKKNTTTLTKLTKWLIDLNADPRTHKIDMPMLMIDDEADNASINTSSDKEYPT